MAGGVSYGGRRGRKKRLMGEINVVPYIDVMLVLLVIFMVTAPLLSTGVDVDLPQADAAPTEDTDQEPFVLTVDANGQYFLNDEESPITSIEEVKLKAAAVLRHAPKTPFMVRGDASVPYGEVVQGMVLLQQAGVPKVGLVTKAPEG